MATAEKEMHPDFGDLEPVREPSPAELAEIETKGPAVGKISGVNHMVVTVSDYERALAFYRDVLGFKLIAHTHGRAADPGDRRGKAQFCYDSIAFMRVADNIGLGLYVIEHAQEPPPASTTEALWPQDPRWPTEGKERVLDHPMGWDHVAWEVPTYADMVFYKEHLEANDTVCSDFFDYRKDGADRFVEHWGLLATEPGSTGLFVDQDDLLMSCNMFFYDPFGNPLEVATRDWSRPWDAE